MDQITTYLIALETKLLYNLSHCKQTLIKIFTY